MSKKRSKATKKNRTQKRVAKTRQRLQDAALSVFIDKGVDATTVEEITEKADLGKGTLYQHFSDKYEIAGTLIEKSMNHLIENLCSNDRRVRKIEDVLEHFLKAHYDFYVNHGEEFILLFQGRILLELQHGASEDLEEPYIHYLEEIENQISPFVSQEIDPIRIRRLACAVAGFVFWFFSFAIIGINDDEIETSVKPLRQVFVRSLTVFLGAVPTLPSGGDDVKTTQECTDE